MAADVDDISLVVEHNRRRRIHLQQDLIGRRLQQVGGSCGNPGCGHGVLLARAGQGRERFQQDIGSAHEGVILAQIEPQPRLDRGEQMVELPDGLRTPQKQHATRTQAVVEQGQQPALQQGSKIDQQVAAGNQVELGEGRIEHDVVGGE